MWSVVCEQEQVLAAIQAAPPWDSESLSFARV
jgi:hypothetical protein